MRSCRGRGSPGAGKGSKRPARGEAVMKRPVGRPCMLLQEQASSSHRPFRPFLWGIHTELVKMASG